MLETMPGWVSIQRVTEEDGPHLELSLNFASFPDPVVVNVDAEEWSKMLANPGRPSQAAIRFMPNRRGA